MPALKSFTTQKMTKRKKRAEKENMWRLLIRTVDIWANSEMMSPTENEDTKTRTVIGIKVKVNVLTHTAKYFYDLYMQVGIKIERERMSMSSLRDAYP